MKTFRELTNELKNYKEATEAAAIEAEEKRLDETLPKEKRKSRRPGAVQLHENVKCIARSEDGSCEVFMNGYCVYSNGDRRTVLWVPDCGRHTYYFNPLNDNEKQYMNEKEELSEELLNEMPWEVVITIAGEDRIENNLHLPLSTTTTDDEAELEETPSRPVMSCTPFCDPCEYLLRKEERKEAESLLTDKQLEAARLHYTMGFNQYEIAKILGISQKAVDYRLNGAEAKVGKKRIKVLLDPAVMAAY